MDAFQLHLALEEAFKLIQRLRTSYIDESTQPGCSARDESKRARLATVMYNLLEVSARVADHAQALHPRKL